MTSIYFIFISILCYLLMFLDCFYWFILFENNCAKGQRIILEEILLLDSSTGKTSTVFNDLLVCFGYRFLWYTDKPTKISKKNSFEHCLIWEKSFEHCLNWERFIITLQQLFHKIPKHFKNSKTIDISTSS